jgi:hypothetical protein
VPAERNKMREVKEERARSDDVFPAKRKGQEPKRFLKIEPTTGENIDPESDEDLTKHKTFNITTTHLIHKLHSTNNQQTSWEHRT